MINLIGQTVIKNFDGSEHIVENQDESKIYYIGTKGVPFSSFANGFFKAKDENIQKQIIESFNNTIQINKNNEDEIKLYDFSDEKLNKSNAVYPICLVYEKNYYIFKNAETSWSNCLKIFYYLTFKKNLDENLCPNYFEKLASEECKTKLNNMVRFSNHDIIDNKFVKFYKELYVKEYLNNLFLNIDLMKHIYDCLKLSNIYLFCSNDKNLFYDDNTLKISISSIKYKKKKLSEKNVKYFISHINGEILSETEKFIIKINHEFDKKIFLGDIKLNDEELLILNNLMKKEFNNLKNNSYFKPKNPKIFAVGMVMYAMKYYSDKTFWRFMNQEFQINISQSEQTAINDAFKTIMNHYNKFYDDTASIKVDNISAHAFVTDKCSKKFFNFLFGFWKNELGRNYDNIYNNKYETFNALVKEILDNPNNIPDVMKHTSIAFNMNPRSCKLRTKHILKKN